jgi:hypothetical protein
MASSSVMYLVLLAKWEDRAAIDRSDTNTEQLLTCQIQTDPNSEKCIHLY